VGQTATFAVAATGTALLTYQWQKNSVAISGATSSNYTTPVTTMSDSGALFSVAVSNAVGTVMSGAATLTVNPIGTTQYILGDTFFPPSTQAKPAKGASYVDANTNLTVTRVTNAAADGQPGGSTGISMNYSTFNPLSSDGNNLILQGLANITSGGNFLIYDANTFAFKQVLTIPFNNGQDPEPRWDTSGSHPTWIYYRSNMQLRYFDIGNQTDNLVRDFTNHPGLASLGNLSGFYIYTGQKGSPSMDTRYWAFLLCSQPGTNGCTTGWAFTWDRQTDTVLGILDLRASAGNTAGVHDMMLSPWGDWVNIGTGYKDNLGGPYDGTQIWNMNFTIRRKVTYGNNPHDMWGLDKQGNHVFVAVNNGDDYIEFLEPVSGKIYGTYCIGQIGPCAGTTHFIGYGPPSNSGVGFLHAFVNKPGWAFISTYVDQGNFRWADNQIFGVELDETKYLSIRDCWNCTLNAPPTGTPVPRIWRIATAQNAVDPVNYYFQQPNAQMDFNGTRIWWGANWRNSIGAMDVYQVTLPPTWATDLR
jgi:hypothetical protein